MNRITIGVHTKSGSTWHFIDRPESVKSVPTPPTGDALFRRARRWIAAALLAGAAAMCIASIADAQTLYEQSKARLDPAAQGCELNPDMQGHALAIIAADATNEDNPIRFHPALVAEMQPAVAVPCEAVFKASYPTLYAAAEAWKSIFLGTAQAQTAGPTTAQFDALQSQVNSIASSVTAMQAQITTIQHQLANNPPPPPPPPAPTIALVGSVAANAYQNPNLDLSAPPLPVTAGNLLVVVCDASGGADLKPTIASVKDSTGNTFAPAVTANSAPGQYGWATAAIFYAKAQATNSADTVTCTANESATGGIVVLQYSGVSTLDITAQGAGSGPNMATQPFTTTAANEVIVATGEDTAGSGNPWVAGSGWTMEKQIYTYYNAEDQITSAVQTNVTATMSEAGAGTAPNVIVSASFK